MKRIGFVFLILVLFCFEFQARAVSPINKSFYFFPQSRTFVNPFAVPFAFSAFYFSQTQDFSFAPISVYRNFELMKFQFPQGAVFCRMEEKSVRRFNVMFSLHAGRYSEKMNQDHY